MSKAGSAAKVKLNSFDDLFGASDIIKLYLSMYNKY